MKTILQIAQDLAPHCGIDRPTLLISATDGNEPRLLRCIIETGKELQSRFDWPQLRKSYTITGAGNVAHNLPSDFSRFIRGMAVVSAGKAVRGSISDDEFNRLTPAPGAARYFRSTPTSIEFWPYIDAPAQATVTYVTQNWLAGDKAEPNVDDDRPLIEDELVFKGALWRYRRMHGHDFKDFLDEYEGDLKRYSSFARAERGP